MTSDGILSETERALKSSLLFAESKVWQRAEMKSDEHPSTYAIYLEMKSPEAQESDYAMRFRIYPMRITVKFEQYGYGKHESEDDQNVVQKTKFEVLDALMLIRDTFDLTATDAYDLQITETFLDPEVEDLKTEADIQRVAVDVDFYTVMQRIAL